jgi:hypothetical protein
MDTVDNELGRLIRTLSEKCSACHSPMQLRARKIDILVRGVEESDEEEYKVCSVCGEEVEIRYRDIKKRKKVFDKTAIVSDAVEKKEGRNEYKQRSPTSKDNGRTRWKSDRKVSGRNT